jgi:hypothetical protein
MAKRIPWMPQREASCTPLASPACVYARWPALPKGEKRVHRKLAAVKRTGNTIGYELLLNLERYLFSTHRQPSMMEC